MTKLVREGFKNHVFFIHILWIKGGGSADVDNEREGGGSANVDIYIFF